MGVLGASRGADRSQRLVLCIGLCLLPGAALPAALPATLGQQGAIIDRLDDPLELQQLAIQYIAANQPQLAIRALSKALKDYAGNAETHMWLGVAHTQMQQLDAAETYFNRALELDPHLTEVHNWLGVFWYRKGDVDRAIQEYQIALADPAYPRISRARVLVNLGNIYVEQGDVEAAIPVLSRAVGLRLQPTDPVYAMAHLRLAEALLKNGRPIEAIGALEPLQTRNLASADVNLYLGLAYRDLGETEDARMYLEEVLRLVPGSPLSERALGVLKELGVVPGS